MEAGLRTVWLLEEASERDITELAKGRERLPLLGDLTRLLIKQLEKKPLRGKLLEVLDSFTHGGAAALSTQFVEGAELEKRNSAIIALAGFALALAGYALAILLRRDDILAELAAVVPDMQ